MYATELAGHMHVYAEAFKLVADTNETCTFIDVVNHVGDELKAAGRAAENVGYEQDDYRYGDFTAINDHLDTFPYEVTREQTDRLEQLAQVILGYN